VYRHHHHRRRCNGIAFISSSSYALLITLLITANELLFTTNMHKGLSSEMLLNSPDGPRIVCCEHQPAPFSRSLAVCLHIGVLCETRARTDSQCNNYDLVSLVIHGPFDVVVIIVKRAVLFGKGAKVCDVTDVVLCKIKTNDYSSRVLYIIKIDEKEQIVYFFKSRNLICLR